MSMIDEGWFQAINMFLYATNSVAGLTPPPSLPTAHRLRSRRNLPSKLPLFSETVVNNRLVDFKITDIKESEEQPQVI